MYLSQTSSSRSSTSESTTGDSKLATYAAIAKTTYKFELVVRPFSARIQDSHIGDNVCYFFVELMDSPKPGGSIVVCGGLVTRGFLEAGWGVKHS